MAKGKQAAPKTPAELENPARPALLTSLRAMARSLSPAERRVADYVLLDPDRVVSSSIVEVRKACGASMGSIVSLCRRLGLRGFADFKLALVRDLALSALPTATTGQDDNDLLDTVFRFHAESLAETRRVNSRDTYQRVTQELAKAARIEFFATGLSQAVAFTAYSKFLLIGLPAFTQSDAHLQLITAAQLTKGQLAFGISCSGATRETIQCLEVARTQGATTVCLTNAMHSPITQHSDHCLFATPSEINYFQAPMASRVTQLAVMDMLFVSLALRNKSRTTEKLRGSVERLMERKID